MRRTKVTVALVVPVLLALFAGAALANHSVIDCKNAASPPPVEVRTPTTTCRVRRAMTRWLAGAAMT